MGRKLSAIFILPFLLPSNLIPTPPRIRVSVETKKILLASTQITNKVTDELAYIMAAVNDYRRSKGLSLVQTDPYTCGFAATRAGEIAGSFNHDGFTNRINNKTLPYPSYHEVTENLAMTDDYRKVVSLWIDSPGHAANMQKDTPYVCVAANGNYYAYEGWRP